MFGVLVFLALVAHICNAWETVSVFNVSEPEDNAPLDWGLAYETSQLYGYNGQSGEDKLTHSFVPTSCGANMSVYHTDPTCFQGAGSAQTPVLLLNHGYPESSYIWRNVTPEVSKRVPVVVPDVSYQPNTIKKYH